MKKKIFLTVLIVFVVNICPVKSDIVEPYTGPTEVLQYTEAVYTAIVYNDSGAWQHHPREGIVQDVSTDIENIGVHLYRVKVTCVFIGVGVDNFLGLTITVKPNPLVLEVPSHACPYGTQLKFTDISSHLRKDISISGNSTAKISETGLLTFDPSSTGIINVKMAVYFKWGGSIHEFEVGSVEKQIAIAPHDFRCSYYIEYAGGQTSNPQDFIPNSNNMLIEGEKTIVNFMSYYENFSWELLTPNNATDISYEAWNGIFKFIPHSRNGRSVRFGFKYNTPGCPIQQTCVVYFLISNNPYDVVYSASSNIISIKRDNENTLSRMAVVNDNYSIIDAMSGVIKKQGILNQVVNEIDASNLPKGVYFVQITSGEDVQSYKISI